MPERRRHGAVSATWGDLDAAVASNVLTAEQAEQLWDLLGQRTSSQPRFDAAHVAYYAGAVIVLSAMGWLLPLAWDALNGFAFEAEADLELGVARPAAPVSPTETAAPATAPAPAGGTVTLANFIRAETDRYFAQTASDGAFGALRHRRTMAAIDAQDVVRMNRDTLYSSGVFDLDAAPLTVTWPDVGPRFMSMQVISEDRYTVDVVYAPGRFTYDSKMVGTSSRAASTL